MRSLQELSQGNAAAAFRGHHGLFSGEFEKPSLGPHSGYYNSGLHGSQTHLNTLSSMAITKYSGDTGPKSLLKR